MKRSTFTSCFIALFMIFLGANSASAQANCSPTCNDAVQASFDNYCQVPLTYDMFLEDGDNPRTCTPNGPQAFLIEAMDHTGKVVASSDDPYDNFLTCEDLIANRYEPFQIKVKHWATGNSCWSLLYLEDKLDPTLVIEDVTLWCNEPFDPDYIEWVKGDGVGYPRAFDNCDELRLTVNGESRGGDDNKHGVECHDLTLEYSDEIRDVECHPDGNVSATVYRTWTTCDYAGNCRSGVQHITIRRLSISQLNLPPNYDDWDEPALRPNKRNGCDVNTMPGLVYDGKAHRNFPGRFGRGGTSQEPTGVPMIHGIPVSRITSPDGELKDGYAYPWDDFGFCEINVDYKDHIIDVCPGTYKILRTWTLVDWCTAEIVEHTQIIKVVDEETAIEAGDDQVISTNFNPYRCEADFRPNNAEIWEACGQVNYATMTIEGYRQRGHPHPVWAVEKFTLVEGVQGTIQGSGTGDPVIITFPTQKLAGPECGGDFDVPATYVVTYNTIDKCGNTASSSYEVEVVDNTAPTPICDEITQTTVGLDCKATIFAQTFDDGSFDNCGPVTFSVRRMDSDDPSYHSYVDFGAADVWKNVEGETCIVALRVTDCNGNYAEDCMVQVIVDDKTGAVTSVRDATIKCSELENNGVIPDALIQSLASADDNCGVINNLDIVEIRDWRNDCHVGFVEYDFRAYDLHDVPSGVVTATITVVDDTPVEVTFPDDFTAFCTETSGGFQGALDPDVTGRPVIVGDDCELVGVSYEDEYVFQVSGSACFKVIREWAVIDWCAFDEDHPSAPQTFNHVQVISVQDGTAPDLDHDDSRTVYITGGGSLTASGGTGDCSTSINVAAPNVTDCSSDVRIRAEWSYEADPWYCGTSATGVVADASAGFTTPEFEPGVLTVTFIGDDGCGNVAKATGVYTIVDGKKPTPFCRDVFTAIMPTSGSVTVWASDLDVGSFDNCDGCAGNPITFAFDASGDVASVSFNCSQLGMNTVDMYVIDEAGNSDFCSVTIDVQNNGGACAGTLDSPRTQAAIAGTVVNEDSEFVEAVTVQAGSQFAVTGSAGTYQLALDLGTDATVVPEKNMDPLNGGSTFDLVLLRKHIVGTQPLDSPYKLIAADINRSGSITSFDMVELRKVVLQLVPNFPNNTSWRFIDEKYGFSSTTDAALSENFPEVYDIDNLDQDMAIDFIAVKVGDLNGNAIPNSFVGAESRNAVGTLTLNTDDRFVQVDEKVTIEFTAADIAQAQGYQFTMNFNGLKFAELMEGAAKAANFNTALASRGIISSSWDGTATADEVLFGLTFTATTSGQLSELLSISSDQVQAEAYNTTGELLDVAIEFNADNTATEFALFQNTPNPFGEETVIGFNLPEAGPATFKVMDVQGKVLRTITNDYTKGFNQININAKDLSATGVLYYQLEAADQVATMKMIIIE